MSLVPAVTELILAELLYLQASAPFSSHCLVPWPSRFSSFFRGWISPAWPLSQDDDPNKPIYMYINSTGTTKDGKKLGYDTEAFAIYDTMK